MAQYRDPYGNIKSELTEIGDPNKVARSLVDKLRKDVASSGTMGKIPAPGEIVDINGLQFKVDRADSDGKRITIELI